MRPVGDDTIRLAATLGTLDLSGMYGVPPGLAETMDVASEVAVAAGMEALKNAGLVTGRSAEGKEWRLDERYRDDTGVVYASSFPAMDAAVGEVMRFLRSRIGGGGGGARGLVRALRRTLLEGTAIGNGDNDENENGGGGGGGKLKDEDELALSRLLSLAEMSDAKKKGASSSSENGTAAAAEKEEDIEDEGEYEFDRKFRFRVLVVGHSQIAQLAGIRGPNAQTNAACAGTTQVSFILRFSSLLSFPARATRPPHRTKIII